MARSHLLAPLLLLLLSGCWTGGPWYGAADNRSAVPDGRYRLVHSEMPGEGDILSIHGRSDGATVIDGTDHPLTAILVPLGGANAHRYVVQLQRDDGVAHSAMFMLLDDSGDRYRLALLPCSRPWSDEAEASGGSISRDPQSAATCTFATRDGLLNSLASVSKIAKFELELVRQAR